MSRPTRSRRPPDLPRWPSPDAGARLAGDRPEASRHTPGLSRRLLPRPLLRYPARDCSANEAEAWTPPPRRRRTRPAQPISWWPRRGRVAVTLGCAPPDAARAAVAPARIVSRLACRRSSIPSWPLRAAARSCPPPLRPSRAREASRQVPSAPARRVLRPRSRSPARSASRRHGARGGFGRFRAGLARIEADVSSQSPRRGDLCPGRVQRSRARTCCAPASSRSREALPRRRRLYRQAEDVRASRSRASGLDRRGRVDSRERVRGLQAAARLRGIRHLRTRSAAMSPVFAARGVSALGGARAAVAGASEDQAGGKAPPADADRRCRGGSASEWRRASGTP